MIRTELERQLPDLTNGEWSLLVKDSYVGEVESGAADIDHLVTRIKDVRQAVRQAAKQGATEELAEAGELAQRAATRSEALSALLGIQAAHDADVVAFRQEQLRNHLVKPENVGDWIDRHAEPATQLVTVAVDRPDEPLDRRFERVLEYAPPPALIVRHVGVALDSTLDRLRVLSESLADRYNWRSGQATVFILTGLVPIVPPIRTSTKLIYENSALSRITLEVDPTLTPREVAARYSSARNETLPSRSRRMSEKHLRLAIYVTSHTEGTWAERMRGWNEVNPSASYSQPSNFQRDAVRAVNRLLNPLGSGLGK